MNEIPRRSESSFGSLRPSGWRARNDTKHMKLNIKYSLSLFGIVALLFVIFNLTAYAQTATPAPTSSNSKELEDKIRELENKVSDLQSQGNSLASKIGALDSQIKLTEYRMDATQQEIQDLEKDIGSAGKRMKNLEGSLTDVSKVLINRVISTYQVGREGTIPALLAAKNFKDVLARANYLSIVQEHDKQLLYSTQQAKNDYANQKTIFESKKTKVLGLKTQLEAYTQQLDQDKNNKQKLLNDTKNDEKKYQELLARARSEFTAIQGIIAGNGAETEAGPVSQGSRIASIIPGASCNSSGGHLHFIVGRNASTESPFSYLKSIEYNNCSGSSCGSSDGDPFNPSGSWDWPISGPITMYQGYGSTWATRNSWVGQIYSFHNGIDIIGSSNEVRAVQSGTLYRGSYAGAGCRLPYVRVHHTDGMDTFYLHVYY
jgi:peptidoglycan hydrolase CwlO-like protein